MKLIRMSSLPTVRLTTELAASSYGQPVLVDDAGNAYGPGDLALDHSLVVDATAEERKALSTAGFAIFIPDTSDPDED